MTKTMWHFPEKTTTRTKEENLLPKSIAIQTNNTFLDSRPIAYLPVGELRYTVFLVKLDYAKLEAFPRFQTSTPPAIATQ